MHVHAAYNECMRTLYHATDVKNLTSIMKLGLLANRCRFKIKRVWMCCLRKRPWSLLHMAKNHGTPLQDVVVLEVRIPRSWLGRHGGGLWYTRHNVPASMIQRVVPISEVLSR